MPQLLFDVIRHGLRFRLIDYTGDYFTMPLSRNRPPIFAISRYFRAIFRERSLMRVCFRCLMPLLRRVC